MRGGSDADFDGNDHGADGVLSKDLGRGVKAEEEILTEEKETVKAV